MKAKQKEPTEKSTGQSSQLHWRQMNRKQRRDLERKIQSADLTLQLVHPDAAGIDIGNESHYVAVPPDRDSQPVQHFGCTTAELRAMADWLKQCRIRTVAMQSTSVYWIAVYDVLEQAGLEVYLVNARETKNLPGRKSDVQESQWLMKLHTYGLLRNPFRPPQEIRTMRTYWRQRNDLVRSAARHIQRIQKTLTQMNMQLANVLSDVSGVTGQAIIKAILTSNRVTVALKLAASNLRTSQSYLGAQFRRLRARLDTPVAIKAMAAKLARLIYRMLRYGTKYVDNGSRYYELQQRTREIRRLKLKAATLGFHLVQSTAA
jgi:hypothetical protein